MFEKIPQQRILLYLLLLGLFPLLIAFAGYFSKQQALNELSETLHFTQQQAFLQERKQAQNSAVRNYYRDADHFYIDKHLETLVFLEPEIDGLQKIANDKNLMDDELIKKRLEHLTGTGNNLIFSEGIVQSHPFFQETTETLVHPVEIDVSDLKKILAKIEGVEIGPYIPGPNPLQLIISNFKLEKRKQSEKNEVFILNMTLLKREFL